MRMEKPETLCDTHACGFCPPTVQHQSCKHKYKCMNMTHMYARMWKPLDHLCFFHYFILYNFVSS